MEVIKALTALLEAFKGVVVVAGKWPTAFTVVGIANACVALPWIREWQRSKKPDAVIERMEKQIEQLAEDNRRYRDVYLARLGFPVDGLKQDAADSKIEAERRGQGGKK